MTIKRFRLAFIAAALIISTISLHLNGTHPTQAQSNWTYLHTSGRNIVDAGGNVVRISGVNWFGAETPDYAPDGLWSRNYKDMMNQMKSLGYNTIRLPFSTDFLDFKDTGGGYTPNLSTYANPELTGIKGVPLLDTIIAYAGQIGMRVFLDRHRAFSSYQSALWYEPGSSKYTEQRWIDDWKWLAQHYANNPTVIGGDLHNEPHGVQGNPAISACWGCGETSRDWRLAAERAGNAILSVNPNWLIIVEGNDSDFLTGKGTWWGGDLSNAGTMPVRLNVANRVVYSPHDYPASIFNQTWFSDPSYPNNMPAFWDSHWGYLAKNNIAPVLIGEWGSRLATTVDQQWFSAMASYIRTNQLSWTFWSWNPNSGDTGGILTDDWMTVISAKQTVLAGLQYPFIGSPGGSPNPTPTRTQQGIPTNTVVPTRVPTTVPTTVPTRVSTTVPTRVPTTGPTTVPTRVPTTGPTTVPTTVPTRTSGGGTLTAQIRSGGTDNNQQAQFAYVIRNTGSSAVSNVSVRIYFTLDGSNAASNYTLEKYYDQSGVATISTPTLASGSTYYFTVSYGTASLPANGQWELQTSLHLANWGTTFSAGNDHFHTGFAVGALPAAYTATNYIPGYVNGTLAGGTQP